VTALSNLNLECPFKHIVRNSKDGIGRSGGDCRSMRQHPNGSPEQPRRAANGADTFSHQTHRRHPSRRCRTIPTVLWSSQTPSCSRRPNVRLCCSHSLRQKCNCSSTSVPLVEACSVVRQRAVRSDEKHIGFASLTARHINAWRLVFRDLEHLLTHR
jgi:hypothetical protein